MAFEACPAALAHASCAAVWRLLEDPRRYDSWWDAETVAVVPPGKVQPGQSIALRARAAGRWWKATLIIEEVDESARAVRFAGAFPLGIRLRNRISCGALDERTCRVQFA